jgi:hypothetical protein
MRYRFRVPLEAPLPSTRLSAFDGMSEKGDVALLWIDAIGLTFLNRHGNLVAISEAAS